MRGTTHAATGAAAWITGSALTGPPHLAALAAGTIACLTGALIPDIDQVGSTISRVGGPASELTAYGVRAVSGGHRHATHSAIGVGFAAAVWFAAAGLAGLAWWLPAALTAGYAVHIAGDCLTVAGCPLAWPSRRRFWLLPARARITTGGRRRGRRRGRPWGEWAVMTASAAAVAAAAILGPWHV